MALAILIAATIATQPLALCQRRQVPVDEVICADPELRAWARASVFISLGIAASQGYSRMYEVGPEAWPAELNACTTAVCAKEAYQKRLADLFLNYEVGERAASFYKAKSLPDRGHPTWRRLYLYDAGEGWTLFWLDVGMSQGTPSRPEGDRTGNALGLVRLGTGVAYYGTADQGVKLKRAGVGKWEVTQVGDCDLCGHLMHLDGVYQLVRAAQLP